MCRLLLTLSNHRLPFGSAIKDFQKRPLTLHVTAPDSLQQMASARKTPLHKLVLKGYLFLYHSAALSLWAIVVFHAFREVVQHGRPLTLKDATKLFTEVFAATAAQLEMVVIVTMLDAVHALLGWIPGPSAGIIVPLLQRGLMLVVLNGMRVLANGLTGGIMVFAWALLEIPRYSYYLFAAFNEEADAVPKTLFFLRYTAFVLVYPMASVCEGLIMWGAFPILTGENNVRKVSPYGYTVSAENASRALKVPPTRRRRHHRPCSCTFFFSPLRSSGVDGVVRHVHAHGLRLPRRRTQKGVPRPCPRLHAAGPGERHRVPQGTPITHDIAMGQFWAQREP